MPLRFPPYSIAVWDDQALTFRVPDPYHAFPAGNWGRELPDATPGYFGAGRGSRNLVSGLEIQGNSRYTNGASKETS